MHQLRVQHIRNQKNLIVQREQLHSHKICDHINQSWSQFSTNKMAIYKIKNKQGKLRNNETRNKQETKQKTNKQEKTLLYSTLVLEILWIKILNSDDIFKKWETNNNSIICRLLQSRCCSLLMRLFVFLVWPEASTVLAKKIHHLMQEG